MWTVVLNTAGMEPEEVEVPGGTVAEALAAGVEVLGIGENDEGLYELRLVGEAD